MNDTTLLEKKQQLDYLLPKIADIVVDRDTIQKNIWDDIQGEVKQFVKIIVEKALESSTNHYLQREKYKRIDNNKDYRNGYYLRTLFTKFGEIKNIVVPRLRKFSLPFDIFHKYQTRQRELDNIIANMYVAGPSQEKIKTLVKQLFDKEISKSCICKITKEIFESGLNDFQTKKLDDNIKYLYLDALYPSIKDQLGLNKDKTVLAAYGIKNNGEKGIVSLRVAISESESEYTAFLIDLKQRGLMGTHLKMIIVDGHQGLMNSLKNMFPFIPIQRCWVHKMRNLFTYLKWADRKACVEGFKKIFYADNKTEAIRCFQDWKRIWEIRCPKAVHCVEKDLSDLLQFYSLPKEDWVLTRSSNKIERCFEEIRRRIKSIRSFPNDRSCERIMAAITEQYINKES